VEEIMAEDRSDTPSGGGVESHEETPRTLTDGIAILATQAFCPNGHNLVIRKNVLFGGHPGISLIVETENWKGEVILSPFQGDPTKAGDKPDLASGTKVKITCPVCGVDLPIQAACGCQWSGDLTALYLTHNADRGDMIMLCNVWGCRRSQVMDNWQVMSEYAEMEEDA
jgi:hypothetical protein